MSNSKTVCTGHFNGLHPNHIQLFHWASHFGEVIVGINDDEINRIKNSDRAIPAVDRKLMLEAIKYIHEVVIFTEPTPSELIIRLKPSYFIKGPDYVGKNLPEEAACKQVGAAILFRPGDYQYSSSLLKLYK